MIDTFSLNSAPLVKLCLKGYQAGRDVRDHMTCTNTFRECDMLKDSVTVHIHSNTLLLRCAGGVSVKLTTVLLGGNMVQT